MLEKFNQQIDRLVEAVRNQPKFAWAVVTSVDPLLIRYDGQDESVLGTPDRLVSGLSVGDRVWVQRQHRRDIVLGKGGGPTGQKILWQGAIYVQAGQHVPMSELVSEQATGIVLCWSRYLSGAPANNDYNYHFVPKQHVIDRPGAGVSCLLSRTGTNEVASKYVYVDDYELRGYAENNTAPRNGYVLRFVYGV